MIDEIRNLKKIELHLHLDGSMLLDTAGILSGEKRKDLQKKMIAPNKCNNLSEYLTKFDFPISLMQSKENLEKVATDLVNYLEQENVIYAEIRFAPMFHTKGSLSMESVVEAVLKGLKSNDKVKTNLILCMMRGIDKEDNLKTIAVAEKYLNKGVCAVDLAGAEDKYPLEEYVELFEIVKRKHIPFTIHAGENGSYMEVKKAIEIGAKRIGHGIHAIDDKETMELIKDNDVLLEICPTSNVQTNAVKGYGDNPILKFYKSLINVSINTDNVTVSNISLTDEYLKLYSYFGFGIEDFKVMNRNTIKGAFLTEEEKCKLLEEI